MIDHGLSRYTNHGCRCDICRSANTRYLREYKARVKADRLADPNTRHGVLATYTNWGCRCLPCTSARNAYDRQRRNAGGKAS